MNRMLRVARVQLLTWPITLVMPWAIIALSFVVHVAIFAAIGSSGEPFITGALIALYIFMLINYSLMMTQAFPLALGMSVIRRTFYAATSLLVIVQSLAFGVIATLLKLLEDATGGWGLSMIFFGIPYVAQDNPALQVLVYAVPLALVAFIGIVAGGTYQRWGALGFYGLAAVTIAGLGLLAVLITLLQLWGRIGSWLGEQSALTMLAGWPTLLVAVLAGAGYLLIRRATA